MISGTNRVRRGGRADGRPGSFSAGPDPPEPRRTLTTIGGDGFATLALSGLVILLTGGLSLAWIAGRVAAIAAREAPAAPQADLIVVLGRRLARGRILPEYAARLRRAAALAAARPVAKVLVVGGRTGGAAVSEAGQGRRFLIGAGVSAERLLLEETSIHTLENLRHARATLGSHSALPFLLVTSRYHMARSLAMARGLGLEAAPCPAEDRLPLRPVTVALVLREAFFLHWYVTGRTWSRWTGNRRSLARIS
jgi:uncharacterized SAM-binding protein YcdF (DUF218 family)